eukprot:3245626-Alexandrium_andersonii.AAC.1
MIEAGEIDPNTAFRGPTRTHSWLQRWRARYGVSWRTVDLRMKRGKEKLLRRLRAFWQNVFAVRLLWAELKGEEELPW